MGFNGGSVSKRAPLAAADKVAAIVFAKVGVGSGFGNLVVGFAAVGRSADRWDGDRRWEGDPAVASSTTCGRFGHGQLVNGLSIHVLCVNTIYPRVFFGDLSKILQ